MDNRILLVNFSISSFQIFWNMDRFLWYIYIYVDSHTPICLDRNQITHWDSFLHSFLLTLQITHVKSLLPEMLHFHKGNQELVSLASRARINILHSNKLIPILSSFLSIPPSGLEKSKMEQEGKPESYPWSAHVPCGVLLPWHFISTSHTSSRVTRAKETKVI